MLRRDKQGTNTSSGWFVWVQKYSDPGPVEKKRTCWILSKINDMKSPRDLFNNMFPLKLKSSIDRAIGPFRGGFYHLQRSLDSEWHMTLASRMVSVFCIVPYHWLLRIVQIVRNHIKCYLSGSFQFLHSDTYIDNVKSLHIKHTIFDSHCK